MFGTIIGSFINSHGNLFQITNIIVFRTRRLVTFGSPFNVGIFGHLAHTIGFRVTPLNGQTKRHTSGNSFGVIDRDNI